MNRVMEFVARLAFGKKLVAGLAFIHDKLDGKKSEIAAGVLALVHVLKLTAVIPPETADVIENALLAILPVTLAARASKIIKSVDNVAK